jgi:hypothetical protein
MPDQNQNNQQPSMTPPVIFPHSDLPPLPPAFQNIPVTDNLPVTPSNQVTNQPINKNEGSAAPPDISSINPKPKKKFGGGKIIATILGLVVLVGGIGAGIILTQQKQLLEQKAAVICEIECSDCSSNETCYKATNGCYACKATTPTTTTTTTSNPVVTCEIECSDCSSNETCYKATNGCYACKATTSNPVVTEEICLNRGGYIGQDGGCHEAFVDVNSCIQGGGYVGQDGRCHEALVDANSCIRGGGYVGQDGGCHESSLFKSTNANSIPITSAMVEACGGGVYASKCKCDGINLTQGCQDNCEKVSNLKENDTVSMASPKCGTIQIDIGCMDSASSSTGNFVSQAASTACGEDSTNTTVTTNSSLPSPTASPIAPYCASVKAYSSTWTLLTSTQLSALTAESVVNFCVSGSSTGTFDKAKFTIKGVELAETTTHRPDSTDFCQSYTLLSTDTTVNVSAQIHDSVLGWF